MGCHFIYEMDIHFSSVHIIYLHAHRNILRTVYLYTNLYDSFLWFGYMTLNRPANASELMICLL